MTSHPMCSKDTLIINNQIYHMSDFLNNQQYLFVCMDLSPADTKQTVIYCSNTGYAVQAQEAIDFNQK